MYHEKLLPAVYAMVRRKTQGTYEFILRSIRTAAEERGMVFNPQHFSTDFESGLMAAIAVQLPHTQLRGCFFHFCQCCFRRAQSLGLLQTYCQNNAHRIILRVFMALAFLPEHEILIVNSSVNYVPTIIPFAQYFQRHWIVVIPPSVWCVLWTRYTNK